MSLKRAPTLSEDKTPEATASSVCSTIESAAVIFSSSTPLAPSAAAKIDSFLLLFSPPF